MNHRDEAVELLQHYMALAMGKRNRYELPADYRAEIALIVDHIIAAVAEAAATIEGRLRRTNLGERDDRAGTQSGPGPDQPKRS